MVTPKRVVETTPLVVAWIRQHERAQRASERSSAATLPERRPRPRDLGRPARLAPAR